MSTIIIVIFRLSVLNSRRYKILKTKPQRRLLGGESAVEGDRISPLKGNGQALEQKHCVKITILGGLVGIIIISL